MSERHTTPPAAEGGSRPSIVFFVHGAPPELTGGTETSVHRLAAGLAELGCRVDLVAGSLELREGGAVESVDVRVGQAEFTVHRLHRGDLFFEHWHKAQSAPARARVRPRGPCASMRLGAEPGPGESDR